MPNCRLLCENCPHDLAGKPTMTFVERMQQEDKAQHIICAFMMVVLLLPLLSVYRACALVFALGLVKEAWDSILGTGFCWYDVAANGIGVLFALTLIALV